MNPSVSLRPVEVGDLPHVFAHQLDPEATRLAAFPARDWEAFYSHWMTNIIGRPTALSYAILWGDRVAGHIGAWTDVGSHERLVGYWLGREFWNQGIASTALGLFLSVESTRPLHARVAQHNLGSIRVLEKAGFVRVGEDAFAAPDGTPGAEYIYRLSTPIA
ncbi:MAG: GNAT family N-acetyltransferase [Candidatus Didemnitutus sp.]|nr:GNAT family N-acetyltransferase [Candidatus Didemnitutus sp.]